MTYILLTNKSWHDSLFDELSKRQGEKWVRLSTKDEFTVSNLNKLKPDSIFIPHWSHIIPEEIFDNFKCILFHMTDLPYGRGGSPLQNLIVKNQKKTKVSALKVEKGLDTGPIYLKKSLSLHGTAQEIFLRSKDVIHQMIVEIIEKNLRPVTQEGEIIEFKRRKPQDGDLEDLKDLEQIFDYIRMLDCEGYPSAFIETEHFKYEFSRASLKSEKEILADVRIIKK